jgi:LysM repeat protein
VRRLLRRFTAGTTIGGLLLLGAPLAGEYVDPADRAGRGDGPRGTAAAGPSYATGGADLDGGDLVLAAARRHPRNHAWRGHPGRRIHHYTVRPGDTATGLAVRFHAWTDELIALNHLGRHARLYAGEKLKIPVVVAAARKARRAHHRAHRPRHPKPPAAHHAKPRPPRHHRAHRWVGAGAGRGTVRRVIVRTANRHDVHPRLALAIAWQESGWQQRRVSPAGALGVMQVMPATGRWMSLYTGRPLHLRHLGDNITAGVMLIKVLRSQARPRRTMAGYYQGAASVRRHGMYPSTRRYVASVVAIRKRLKHGWNPAR